MRALKGLRVLVTRPKAQSAEFIEKLEALGTVPLLLPAIEIIALENDSLLKAALAELASLDWIVFTSVNGVAAVNQLVNNIPGSVKIAAIGPSTGAAVEKAFRKPDAVPDEYLSDAIGPTLGDVRGKRILLARADIARKELAEQLRARGALVNDVAAYRIVRSRNGNLDERPDVITATSSSSVLNTLHNLRDLGHGDWSLEVPWVCIGPITADTAREQGCTVAQMASEYTIDGLIAALLRFTSEVAA